jgi:competence protein ComEC
MRISGIVCVFAIVYLLRLLFAPSLLPPGYTDGDQVSYEFVLLDYPVQVGNKFRYTIGHTTIEWDSYQSMELGESYLVEGKMVATVQLGITTALKLMPHSTKLVLVGREPNLGERLLIFLSGLRKSLTTRLAHALPEPESSLAAGILLGIKRDLSYDFRTSLIRSGTLHTVAASGYNVNLVARYLLGALVNFMPRQLAVVFAAVGILIFCLLAGSSAAVLRAGIMGALILLGSGLGRPSDAKRLLGVAAGVMLLIDPLYLFDVGWQLSIAATAGILYLEPILSTRFGLPNSREQLNKLLKEFWWPTLAATLATSPISYLTFGELSLIGPVANLLILPVIPLIMSLTTIYLLVSSLSYLAPFCAAVLYVPLTYFVRVVNFFGSL